MDRERLTRLLEEPGKVAREDMAGLKDLAQRYPWFGGAQLLHTLGEQRAGDVLYDGTLNKSAAHLPSRAALFDAIHTPVIDKLYIVRPNKEEIPVPPPEVLHPEPIAIDPEPPAVIAPPIEVPAPEETTEVAPDPLDMEIRRAAMASGYELLMEHPPEKALSTALDSEGQLTAPRSIDLDPILDPELVAQPPVGHPRPVPSVHTQPPAAPVRHVHNRMRFTDWLETPADAVVGPNSRADHLPVDEVSPQVEQTDPRAVAGSAMTGIDPVDTSTLIDRFIQQSAPEPKTRAAFFTPQQAAKQSLNDTAGLVTETLARIYAKQGNPAKAIEAYHKLALKFPEKSAYFAALAKAVEAQQNK